MDMVVKRRTSPQKWSAMVEEKVVRYTRSGNPVDAPKGTVHHIRRDSVANMTGWQETLTEEEIARVYEINAANIQILLPEQGLGNFRSTLDNC
jgi:hypothetical protein